MGPGSTKPEAVRSAARTGWETPSEGAERRAEQVVAGCSCSLAGCLWWVSPGFSLVTLKRLRAWLWAAYVGRRPPQHWRHLGITASLLSSFNTIKCHRYSRRWENHGSHTQDSFLGEHMVKVHTYPP